MRARVKAILERNKRLRAAERHAANIKDICDMIGEEARIDRARGVTFMTVPEMPTPSVETGDKAFEHPTRLRQ